MSKGLLYGLVGAVVLALVVWRQLQQRTVNPRRLITIPLLFALAGLLSDKQLGHELSGANRLALFAGGLVVGAGMGVLRGLTVQVWREHGAVFTKGNWKTVTLWVATIAVRIGMAVLGAALGIREGTGEAYLFVAVTFAVQNAYVYVRANRLLTVGTAGLGSESVAG